MRLQAGERLSWEESEFLQVISGKLEVYAFSRGEGSFRQLFLMECTEGEAAYSAQDEFERIGIQVYAVTDAEVEILPLEVCDPTESSRLMGIWFHKLSQLAWVRRMANLGDDMLQKWCRDSVFSGTEDALTAFRNHESILSMLIGARFSSEDKQFSKQLDLRRRRQDRLLDSSVAMLLDEESDLLVDNLVGDKNLEEAAFVVGRIANALSMPTENIKVPQEIARKMDQLNLIRRLVQKVGMQMRLVHLEEGWHAKDNGVMLGYYGAQKELAALLPVTPTSYRLVTRSQPEGIIVTEAVAKDLDKDAFACYAGLPPAVLAPIEVLRFIGRHIWKKDCWAVLMASFIAGFVALAVPMVTETVFQDIIPIFDYEGLVMVTQIAILAGFTTLMVTVVRSIAVLRLSVNVDMSVEAALLGRLFSLPTRFFRRFQSGELVGRLMGVSEVKAVMKGDLLATVFNLVFSFWSLVLMCYYSLKLTVIVLALWLIYLAVVTFFARKYLPFTRAKITAHNGTSGLLQQIFAGLSKFRLHGAEGQAFYLWSRSFGEEWKWNLKLRWQKNHLDILSSVEPLIILVILYVVVSQDFAAAVAQGKDPYTTVISYAQFVAFQTAFTGLNATINEAIPLALQTSSLRPHIENLMPLLEEVPEATDDRMEAGVLSGAIRAEHLTFSYTPEAPDVLRDVNVDIPAGEHVAIVGRSGGGKSTLVRLLLGFEKPKTGAIYYDGQDLADLNPVSVRTQMGVVLQNGQLMTGDIFSNIVGTLSLSQEDAWAAAEAAGIADDIRNMPMGMQTVISEGSSNISGGQRQRILIARALAGHPSIIVFDEATSALDNRTQSIVTESLKKMSATRIVVAHRLSTIREADRILVVDGGTIAESGTFDELVARGGLFAELVKRQVA